MRWLCKLFSHTGLFKIIEVYDQWGSCTLTGTYPTWETRTCTRCGEIEYRNGWTK